MVPQIGTDTWSGMSPQPDNTRQPEKAGSQVESITDRHTTGYIWSDPFSAGVTDDPALSYPVTGTQPILDNGRARQPEHQSHKEGKWLTGKQPTYTPRQHHRQVSITHQYTLVTPHCRHVTCS